MNQRFYDIASRVVDLLMDVVCVVDEHGVFVYISSSCEKVFGYTQQEMLGTNMINYVHPEDRNKTLAIAAQIMREKNSRILKIDMFEKMVVLFILCGQHAGRRRIKFG